MKSNTSEYGTSAEVRKEELYVESGTHQNHFEHLEARKKFTQNYQQKVTESISLMNLILDTQNTTHESHPRHTEHTS